MMDDEIKKQLASLKTRYYTGHFRMYPDPLGALLDKAYSLGFESGKEVVDEYVKRFPDSNELARLSIRFERELRGGIR